MAEQKDPSADAGDQATIELPIPASDPTLFRHTATDSVLRLLLNHAYEQFTIREAARLTDNSPQSVKRAVDVLEVNGMIVTETEGNRRLVGVNRDRASKPDDPVLRIPQSGYHPPVRAAIDRLREELVGVQGVIVFGSVARGRADRRSDIDLWVLVEDRSGQQHRANEIAKSLGNERYDGDRYEFQILVESIESARNHGERLEDVLVEGITLVDSDDLYALKQQVLSGG